MKRQLIRFTPLALTLSMLLFGCDSSTSETKESYITLGQQNPFTEDSSDTLVSVSDKENVYYCDGSYYVIEDSVVKQTQTYDVIPRDMTLLDYFKSFTDYSQEKATMHCLSMDGTESVVDLSTRWDKCSFGELVVYWETTDSKGILLTLYPDNVATVNEFLYYTDLVELFEATTIEG